MTFLFLCPYRNSLYYIVSLTVYLGIVVKCFQSERSSGQSLQFLHSAHQKFNLYLIPVVSSGFFVCFSWRGYSSPARTPHWLQNSASSRHQTRPLFYPVRQLNHVCRVDAEEDTQDFCPLCLLDLTLRRS